MGTRGFYAYRRGGRYFIRYNHRDSYPSRLGKNLVNQIPQERDAFQQWKSFTEKWFDDLYEHYLESITPPTTVPTEFELVNENSNISSISDDNIYFYENGKEGIREGWSVFPPEHTCNAEWTYIIDLDRDAFTIDGSAHYRLSNMPEDWLDHIQLDDNGLRCMPTTLSAEHLAMDVFVAPPPISEDLVALYDDVNTTMIDPPVPSHPVRTRLMLILQSNLESRCSVSFKETRKEWGPMDIRMQKLVYALVKFSTWECLRWECKSSIIREYLVPVASSLLQTATFPRQSEYYIPITNGKVLISLAIHLDKENIFKMAVAKVIRLTPEGKYQVACIISLEHVVIVHVDKTSTPIKVAHTKLLNILDDNEGGKTLIATLSPFAPRLGKIPPTRNLPIEIVEQIFRFLATDHPNTIPSFACACKLFAALVHDRVVRLPGCTLLNYPNARFPGCIYGVDDDGWIGMYNFGDKIYPIARSSPKRKVYLGMVDGAEIGEGLSRYCLAPVDIDLVQEEYTISA